ncbi:MAG: hypothetical protein ACFCVA_06840 [Gammaproteobacteria bacterium]
MTLRSVPRAAVQPAEQRGANAQGFSLHAKRRPPIIPDRPVTAHHTADELDGVTHHASSARMRWARLLKRVFDIDLAHCPHCGTHLKITAAIEHPSVMTSILHPLGLPTRAPPGAPARSFDRLETA